MKRVVLLGTGTDVGKTYVGSRLLSAWAEKSPCLALKPVESGVRLGGETDARQLARRRSGLSTSGPADEESGGTDRQRRPYLPEPNHFLTLREPLSPHLAARRSGVSVDVEGIIAWIQRCEKHYTALHDDTSDFLSLIETAGGAFSPLSETETCADLASRLDPAAWILVAPDALGVLHDVSAALLALHARHRAPDIVVLSAARPPDSSIGVNAEELTRTVFPLLGEAAPRCRQVPRLGPGADEMDELIALLRAGG